jgi:Fe-S-cluster-containing hydrogenase component 2
MNRFGVMSKLLSKGRFFKLVCGAGNEDAENVRRLVIIYTLAGAKCFDVSAEPRVVRACVSGIDTAFKLAAKLKRNLEVRPFVMVSVGMSGDHHVRKATITGNCVACGKCIMVCPTDAILDSHEVVRERCIGCGNCAAMCPPRVSAIRFEHNMRALENILPACLEAGAENIELHAAVPNDDAIMEEWKLVNKVQPNHFVSMCLDRYHLSNSSLIERIRQAKEIAGDRLIIQADGIPMGGAHDDFNTTLQAIAIADIINKDLMKVDKKFENLPMLLSGGTNSKTAELAQLCNVPWAGIAIGTFARGIVKRFVVGDRFDFDMENLTQAVAVAEGLVLRSIAA